MALLAGAVLLAMTGVTLGGGSPAAMSNRGWMMSLLNTAFFCHRLRTRTILLWRDKQRDVGWLEMRFNQQYINHKNNTRKLTENNMVGPLAHLKRNLTVLYASHTLSSEGQR